MLRILYRKLWLAFKCISTWALIAITIGCIIISLGFVLYHNSIFYLKASVHSSLSLTYYIHSDAIIILQWFRSVHLITEIYWNIYYETHERALLHSFCHSISYAPCKYSHLLFIILNISHNEDIDFICKWRIFVSLSLATFKTGNFKWGVKH